WRSGEWPWSGRRYRGWVLFLIREFAHDFRLGHHYAIDGGDARHLGDAGLALEHLHLHAQRVAGHHGSAEARVFDGYQQHQFAIAVRDGLEHQHAGGLRHGFHDEHARHHREIGEMAREKRFVVGHVLDADDAVRVHFDDAVHQKKGEAVGQDSPNFSDIQNGHGSSYYNAESVLSLRPWSRP